MLDVKRIKHQALKRLIKSGDASKINAGWRRRVGAIVSMLNIAADPKELDLPGFAFHELNKPRKGTYAVTVQGNWRITFKWDDQGPFDVDMEDYHGR
jgi:proteic killer suppression protein